MRVGNIVSKGQRQVNSHSHLANTVLGKGLIKQRGLWLLGERQEVFCFGGLGAL